MLIDYIGCSEKYLAEGIMLLFFPAVKFADDADSLRAAVSLEKADGDCKYSARCEITFKGKTHSAEEEAACADKSDREKLLGRCIYKAASAVSGKAPVWGMLTGIRPAKLVKEEVAEGIADEAIAARMKKECFVDEKKTSLCIKVAKAEAQAERYIGDNTASVYVSVPFCPSRCAYCSFVSHSIEKAAYLMPKYTEAVCREIEAAARACSNKGTRISSVYIGGGTPTALGARELETLVSKIRECFPDIESGEFTAEAGRPDTVTREKLAILKNAGVTRVCINPQTLHDKTLETVGRKHTVKQFYEAFAAARDAGFCSINCDLIAGLPNETAADFKYSIDGIISLKPENITVHSLAVKRAARMRSGADEIFGEQSEIGKMLESSQIALDRAGFRPYYLYRQKNMLGNFENVGYQKNDSPCLYNILMMGELQIIISLGAGAVSKKVYHSDGKIDRIYNPKYPYEYIDRADALIARKTEFIENL